MPIASAFSFYRGAIALKSGLCGDSTEPMEMIETCREANSCN